MGSGIRSSNLVLFVLAQHSLHVLTSYPKCEELQTPPWTFIDTFERQTAITDCKNACRTGPETTLCAVRRNGHAAGMAKCYCGDTATNQGEACTWDCSGGTDNCGGSNSLSAHPVCPLGTYGIDDNCATSCPGTCEEDVCDVKDGKCHGNCMNGWYGSIYCDMQCPNCANDKCAKDTGVCDGGCDPGWYETTCTASCSSNCANVACDINDGACDGGCTPGWYKPQCTRECSPNCKDKECLNNNGSCANGCVNDMYGSHCNFSCPSNCAGGCQRYSGDCTSCLDGYYGEKCTKPCPKHCKSSMCGFNSGNCSFGCEGDRYYGSTCDKECSGNCNGTVCDFHDGTCTYQCTPGYYSPKCDNPCPKDCMNNLCDFMVGNCTHGCKNEHYGQHYCDKDCPVNCAGDVCGLVDGACTQGCKSGWNGTKCNADIDECLDEKQHNCTGPDYKCENVNGTYKCCTDGLEEGKEVCAAPVENPPKEPKIGAIIGICLAVIVIAGAIVAGLFYFRHKKHKKRPNESSDGFSNPVLDDSEGDSGSAPDNRGVQLNIHPPVGHDTKSDMNKASMLSEVTVDPASVYANIPEKIDDSDRTCRINDFPEYVFTRKNIEDYFRLEYESLPTGTLYDWGDARREEVSTKNRFKGIYPYNHNRVVLEAIEDLPGSEYINASRVQGYVPTDKFIAALGPRKNTKEDFWRMVWQEKITTIVMVTNLTETGVEKCVLYWPKGNTQQFGDINVMINRVNTSTDTVIRKFMIQKGDHKRMVTHYHFTEWSDHSVPDATALLNFRRKIIKAIRPNVPMVVHCSAGVGRTGTLIALDYLIKQAEAEGQVNVFECVEKLRHQRKSMVQSAEQYVFLHEALAEYIRVGNTCISKDDFSSTFKELMGAFPGGAIHAQYQMLQDRTAQISEFDKEYALSTQNKGKNRHEDLIPASLHRVYLTSRIRGRNDYINAVRVNGFQDTDVYQVTQFPLEDTVIDFWRMMQDGDSNAIVTLLTKNQAKEAAHYLPAKNRPMDVMDSVAYVRSSMTTGPFRTMDICLGDKDENNQYMNMDDISKLPIKDTKFLRVFEISIPESQECVEPGTMLEVYKELQQWRRETDNKKITVTCLNGAQYSGQFVACCNIFEMIRVEQEVDIYQATKYIRDSRPQFINTIAQYRNLHEAAMQYLAEFETYANA